MINDYLSFDNFLKSDLEDFIKLLPKDLLAKPISKKKKYGKEVGIKGFRPESYQLSVLSRIYVKEIMAEKEIGFLGHCLLMNADGLIKSDLNHEDYTLLSEKKYNSEELDRILNILLEKESINSKYLLMMLDLNKEQYEKYNNISFDKQIAVLSEQIKNKDDEIQEIKNELEKNNRRKNKFESDIDKLKNKNSVLVEDNKKLNDENIALKEKLENADRQDKCLEEQEIIESIFKGLNGIDNNIIYEIYKELNLKKVDDYLPKIYKEKLTAFEDENYDKVSNYIFIEYILTKLKEIEKNGQN